MSSEFYIFDDDGKDNAARRTLFNTFINVVAPDQKGHEEKSTLNIDLEQDRHFAGFRKSAGIWYHNDNDKKDKCWDRRLVLWMRAQKGGYLPFYDTNGELVTVRGKPLEEAAVCTLEVVLRNTASYSTGFLLLPKYKRRQEQCISKASSWIVIGYFPFPSEKNGPIKRIDGCETDQGKIQTLLLAHTSPRDELSKRVAARDGDFKPSSSSAIIPSKRTCKMPCGNQTKRRNIDPELDENTKQVKPEVESSPLYLTATASKKEQEVDTKKDQEDFKDEKMSVPETMTVLTDRNDKELSMCSEDEKDEDDYEYVLPYNSQIDFDTNDFDLDLFPQSGLPSFGAGASDFMPDFDGSQLSPAVQDVPVETPLCGFTPAASESEASFCAMPEDVLSSMMEESDNGNTVMSTGVVSTEMVDLFRSNSFIFFQPAAFEVAPAPAAPQQQQPQPQPQPQQQRPPFVVPEQFNSIFGGCSESPEFAAAHSFSFDFRSTRVK